MIVIVISGSWILQMYHICSHWLLHGITLLWDVCLASLGVIESNVRVWRCVYKTKRSEGSNGGGLLLWWVTFCPYRSIINDLWWLSAVACYPKLHHFYALSKNPICGHFMFAYGTSFYMRHYNIIICCYWTKPNGITSHIGDNALKQVWALDRLKLK